MKIHSTAVVAETATIASDVIVGPFCVIEHDAVIGPRCELASGVVVKQGCRLGAGNVVEVGAVLGGAPQHLAAGDRVGGLEIGDDNQIREYVTIHRAFQPDQTTLVGNKNMLMAASHIAHDCRIGDANILANNAMLAGHVEMGNRNYIGGGAAFHQFCRVGDLTMVGGLAKVKRDVPPFVTVDGDTGLLVGLNTIGLRRAGMSPEDRSKLKGAYRLAFRSGLTMEEKLHALAKEYPGGPAKQLWQFLSEGTRGITPDRRRSQQDSRPPITSLQNNGRQNTADNSVAGRPDILPFRKAG